MNRRSIVGAQAVLLVVLVAVACDPSRSTPFYSEGFEELCDGTPCGWERSVGTPDQATWVETVQPGEHALRLSGTVTVRGPGSDAIWMAGAGTMFMRLTVRCERGSSLTADIVINEPTGSRTVTQLVSTQDEWTEGGVTIDAASRARIVAIVLTKTGAGSCEIADIVVDDPFFFDEGC